MSTWIKVYNSMPSHPKLLMAGDRAGWLFICGLCYSNEHLTDGFIAQHVLPVAAPGVKSPEALAERLVAAGLWHAVEGGWRIHDYDGTQRTAAEIRERRAADSARKAGSRSNGSPQNVRADSERTHGDVLAESGPIDVDVDVEESREENNISSDADRADVKVTDQDRHLCTLLRQRATERNPKFKVKSRSRWLTDMRLLRDNDGNDPGEIERVIEWVFRDDFWGGVIQSPGNLREHFPRIWDRMNRPGAQVHQIAERQSRTDRRKAAFDRVAGINTPTEGAA